MNTDADRTERLRRALALARAGLERAPDERAAWLARETAGDAALHDEAWALLQFDGVPPQAFERIGEAADPAPDPLLGATVGSYRIERRIGSGGMGTVYRATPVTGVTRQPVALKVVKRGMDSEDVLARFMRERQILAGLAHPNIARLLDGGLTADGRPWFAMELVDGEPLTTWCDARRLGVARRVELFLGACEAVAYAHRNLVVHRDLKPANVLVTDAGEVKLLDFGIAKLLDGAADATRTRAAMTPEYAAPEQFARGPVTTQTDVWQLGLLLHELLAGRRASRNGEGGSTARLDAGADDGLLAERAAARGTTAAALQRALRGDIARIVRRAMHHDVARRYASVAALADDLGRWLRNEPVSATDDTLAYRARMFLRRHRAGVGAAAAVVLALGIGLGLALREARELRRAERSTENALGVLEDVFLGADPWRAKGGDTRAVDLLASARTRIAADITRDPAMAARLLDEIGEVFVSLGDRASAEGTLREAVRAGELAGAAATVPTASARARLAHYRLVGDGDRAAAGELDAAIAQLRTAGRDGRVPLAKALEYKVDDAFNRGDYAAIPALSNEAVQLYRAASGAMSVEYAGALGNQASLLRAIGRPADALAPAAEAWRIIGELGGAPPGARLYAEQQYAGALAANGRGAEAEPLLRDALARVRVDMPTDHDLADAIAWELASTQATIGRFDDAADGLRALLAHIDTKSANLAAVHNMLGSSELARGDARAARQAYENAVRLLCTDGQATPPCVIVRLNLAEALLALGAAEAAPLLHALDADIGVADGRARHRWRLLEARRLLAAGEVRAARGLLAPLLAQARATTTEPTLDDANVLAEAAAIEAQAGERDAALADYRAAERRLAAIWAGEPPQLAKIRARIAALEGPNAAAGAISGP
jgi:serine/threonine-protein kinase